MVTTIFSKRSKLFALALLVGSLYAKAQTTDINRFMPKDVPQSPNVASLGKFGSYEVSHYTGLPQISIPIFEVKSGSLTLPITLSYHASGIKLTDQASWVGLGWSLSGFHISRQTRGKADETGFTAPMQVSAVCGPYGTAHFGYVRDVAYEILETQPDIFSYLTPQSSGTFFLGQSGGSPLIVPYEPIQISNSSTLDKFEITGTDGVLHRFGTSSTGATAMETTSVDRGAFVGTSSRTAWHLMEMLAPNSDDRIDISYQDIGWITQRDVTTNITITDNCISNGVPCPSGTTQVQPALYVNALSTISQMGINEINFEGGKVKFITSTRTDGQPNAKRLDRIEIYSVVSGALTPVKAVRFNYTMFTGANQQKLDKIEFLASDFQTTATVINSYSFDYNTNSFSWDTPQSMKRDYWNFYSGLNNVDLVPAQQVSVTNDAGIISNVQVGSADRSTVTTYMTEGVLKRINFPTGGYTEFEYETHKYLEGSTTTYAGGLRVTKITSSDGSGTNPIVKSYKYGSGESGYGVKNFDNKLIYYHSENADLYQCCIQTPTCQGYMSYRTRTYFSNSLIGIDPYEGSPVVYPYVTEYFGDATTNVGKIIYEYDNGQYTADSLQVILGPASSRNYRCSFDWKRGHLTKKTVYDKTLVNKISEQSQVYSVFKAKRVLIGFASEEARHYDYSYCPSFSCNNEFGNPIDPYQFYYTHYYQSTGKYLETSAVETTFEYNSPTKSIVKNSSTAFDSEYLLPTQETETDVSTSTSIVNYSKYPISYTFPGNETGVALAIKTLKSQNLISVPIERYMVRQKSDGSNPKVIAGAVTTFRQNENNTSQIVPDEIFEIESSSSIPLASFTPSSISSSNLTKDPTYKSHAKIKAYDANGNVSEVAKDKDYTTAYIWGYDNTLPVAVVQNSGGRRETGIAQTFSASGTYSANSTTDIAASPTISIAFKQNVTCTMQMIAAGTPTSNPSMDIVLKKSDGTIAFDPPAYVFEPNGFGGSPIYSSTFSLSPGTYTFYYHGSANSSTLNWVINLYYQSLQIDQVAYHTSFEETGTSSSNAKTGSKINLGTYTLQLPTVAGTYSITWWQLDNQNSIIWNLQTRQVTIPGSTSYVVGFNSPWAVDEVRLYPDKALMTTYTYKPTLGITTSTDPNNVVTYFEYDTFGRLKNTKDYNGKILKNYQYHYKTQN